MTSGDLTPAGNVRRRTSRVRNPPSEPWVPMTREKRAEPFYLIFACLGSSRSIKAVHEACEAGGLRIGLRTLETYSADFNWQQRAAQWDAERSFGLGVERDALARAIADDALHSELGNNLALFANKNVQRLIASMMEEGKDKLTLLDGPGLARVAEAGVRIARTSGAAAMDKRDVMLAIASLINGPIANLFTQSLNALFAYLQSIMGDAFTSEMRERAWEEAATRYGQGVDYFLDATFQSAGITDVIVGELAAPAADEGTG